MSLPAAHGPIAIAVDLPTPHDQVRAALHAAGYTLEVSGVGRAIVTRPDAGAPAAEGLEPIASVVLVRHGRSATAGSMQLSVVPLAPPFTPERIVAAVDAAWRAAEGLREGARRRAALIALHGRAVACCADPERAPDEVAGALAALLRDAGYAGVRVALGETAPAGESDDGESDDTEFLVPVSVAGADAGVVAAVPPLDIDDLLPTGEQRRVLETIAAQMATYLARRAERERAERLRDEEARRARGFAALNDVALAVASLDFDRALDELLPRTCALLGADCCWLLLGEEAGERLVVHAAAGPGAVAANGLRLPAAWPLGAELGHLPPGETWHAADPAALADLGALLPAGTMPGAAIGAPLLARGGAIGALITARQRSGDFAAADRQLLATIAAQAAVAVENARLYADTLQLARFDSLTGLANRRYFLELLDQAVRRAARYARPLALLLIDLDEFKAVNDTFGHLAGDAILRQTAERLGARIRRSDIAARYAGDELAVILPETSLSGALTLAEHLRAAIGLASFSTGEAMPIPLTVSIGVATHGLGVEVNDLLRAADSALYFAKLEGRDRVRGPDAARAALAGEGGDLATILRGGNQAVIEELAVAVDARVPQNAGQATLVAATAAALGAALGLSPDDLDTLRSAALVHDIGEVAIAPDVLGHPGPLGEREWAQIRAHPRRGYDLLSAVPAFRAALPLILHHHERWDGTGYPDGLAGDAIPLGARISAVADAWVALTTDRPHRAARPAQDALAEIIRGAGTQFDPAVVRALSTARLPLLATSRA